MLTETQKNALNDLIKRATDRYPYNAARILRGAELVLDEGVVLHPDDTATVTSNYHEYRVSKKCHCVDAVQGNAPDGHCKHKWAKCFAKHLSQVQEPDIQAEVATWTERDYVATASFDGIARVQDGGWIHFYPYTKEGLVLNAFATLAPHKVALGSPVLAVESQYGPIEWAPTE